MTAVSGEVAVVIVAAGAGRRLGGVAKALLPARAENDAEVTTFLAAIAATAAAAGAGRTVVVIGPPHGERVDREARRLGLDVAHNPDPGRGMSSSVAIGFAHAIDHFGAARSGLLWPVDHARVAPATVARLLAQADQDHIVIPTWNGRGGHPTGFGRALWPQLAACTSLPRGARSLLELHAHRARRIPVDDPGVTADVDRAEDLL